MRSFLALAAVCLLALFCVNPARAQYGHGAFSRSVIVTPFTPTVTVLPSVVVAPAVVQTQVQAPVVQQTTTQTVTQTTQAAVAVQPATVVTQLQPAVVQTAFVPAFAVQTFGYGYGMSSGFAISRAAFAQANVHVGGGVNVRVGGGLFNRGANVRVRVR